MRTHGIGLFSAAYFWSFAISRFDESARPRMIVWQPMQVLTAGMPTSADLLALLWQ
jgi:hypothetical protein